MRESRRERRNVRARPAAGITRNERDRSWSAHLTRRGRTLTGSFADAVWGGRAPAKLAAQYLHYESLLRSAADTRERHKELKQSRGRYTGVVGVSMEPYKVGGRWYQRYVAEWRDEQGRPRRRRFSVRRYGREEARRLAIKARRAGVAATRRAKLTRQREEALRWLRNAPPRPRQVKDPRDRKGINMGRRRPRRKGAAWRGLSPSA